MTQQNEIKLANIETDYDGTRNDLFYLKGSPVFLINDHGEKEYIDDVVVNSVEEAANSVFNSYANQPVWDLQWEAGIIDPQ